MLKKADEELKKKAEEAEVAKALQEFETTFQNTNKIDRAWIKGGVVNPGTGDSEVKGEEPPSSSIYKPSTKLGDRLKTLEVGKVESKSESVKKPVIGRKIGQGKKMTNLELFKEELKSIQQQREQRHQLRQMNRARGISDSKFPQCTPVSEFSLEIEETDRRNRCRDYSAGGYPYDEDSDKSSTNLFLGNLNPKMTEQQLCDIFGRYGPLASVKIMWPRTEEQRSVARNCGFVAFMNRIDAERALENLRGKELMGYEMKLGWGKTVHVPPYPVYVPPALLEIIKPPSQSGLPFNAQPREWLKPLLPLAKERANSASDSLGEPVARKVPSTPERFPFNIHTMEKEKFKEVLEEAVVKVVVPADRTVLATIHRLIEFVVREGPQFEAAIMHREEKNPHYKFLFDYQTSEHLYYRWKLWSILHGEAVNKWSQEEFRMYEGGPLWRPPPIDFFANGMPEELVEPVDYPVAPGYSGKDDEALDAEPREEALRRGLNSGSNLTDAQRGRLAVWINDLEPSRAQVGDVMFWCLEHADAAADVVDVITKSFKPSSKSDSTSTLDIDCDFSIKPPSTVQAITARLFLTSDILYNSGAKVPNASFYRKCFESRLREMFADIGVFYRELEGKLKAEQLKQKVMLCFRAWEEWAIYPNEFLIQLQNIFLGLTTPSNAKESTINPLTEEELAGVPLEPSADASGTSGAVVGVSNVESLDGAPLVQYDGDPLDVDGSPLNTGDDKSAPKNEDDFEGVPLGPSPQTQSEPDKSAATASLFVPSKWESVDPEKAVEEAVTSNRWDLFADPTATLDSDTSTDRVTLKDNDEDVDGRPLDGFGVVGIGLVAYDDDDAVSLSPPSPAQLPSEPMSDSRRQALREIEMKVMKYQDDLEASRKRGDSSVTDDAIAKQVDRFRERLLEKLEETTQGTSSKSPYSRSAKSIAKVSKPSSGSKRHHTSGSLSVKRHEESRSSHRKRSKSPDDRRASPSNSKRPKTDTSEGRHRDRSPRRSRRSRSPSPSKRRSSNAFNTRSLKRK